LVLICQPKDVNIKHDRYPVHHHFQLIVNRQSQPETLDGLPLFLSWLLARLLKKTINSYLCRLPALLHNMATSVVSLLTHMFTTVVRDNLADSLEDRRNHGANLHVTMI
jgi:hypothetical protein